MTLLVIIAVVAFLAYGVHHGRHAVKRYRHHSHLSRGARIRVSIPGPFGTYVGKSWRL